MKSKEAMVKELLGVDSETIKVSLPAAFYHRLVLAGRRRYGTLPRAQVAKKALAQAAALGLIDWEKDLNGGGKTGKVKGKKA